MKPTGLVVESVTKSFNGIVAVNDVSLHVADGELVSILGPSGCGKSTLLRIIAGLIEPDSGSLFVDGSDVRDVAPKNRSLAFVFQNYALYPHLTARRNIAAPLFMTELSDLQRLPFFHRFVPGSTTMRASIAARVQRTAAMLDIEQHLDRRPSELSGGQRQRVALGRALIRQPKLFLLDEPLANLDSALRTQTRSELHAIQRKTGASTLFVTHDQAEAMAISDRVAVMFAGQIRQIATPDELYRNPVDIQVARFMSQPYLNVLAAKTLRRSGAFIGQTGISSHLADDTHVVAFRPESCRILASHERHGISVVVDRTEHAGADAYVFVSVLDGGKTCVVRVPSAEMAVWKPATPAKLQVNMDQAWVFPGEVPIEDPVFNRQVA